MENTGLHELSRSSAHTRHIVKSCPRRQPYSGPGSQPSSRTPLTPAHEPTRRQHTQGMAPPIPRLDDVYGPPGLRQYRALDRTAEAAWCPAEGGLSFEEFVAAGGVRASPPLVFTTLRRPVLFSGHLLCAAV